MFGHHGPSRVCVAVSEHSVPVSWLMSAGGFGKNSARFGECPGSSVFPGKSVVSGLFCDPAGIPLSVSYASHHGNDPSSPVNGRLGTSKAAGGHPVSPVEPLRWIRAPPPFATALHWF